MTKMICNSFLKKKEKALNGKWKKNAYLRPPKILMFHFSIPINITVTVYTVVMCFCSTIVMCIIWCV